MIDEARGVLAIQSGMKYQVLVDGKWKQCTKAREIQKPNYVGWLEYSIGDRAGTAVLFARPGKWRVKPESIRKGSK